MWTIHHHDISFSESVLVPQTNHLGPYTLTRLLEKKLVDSGARVVTVASVLHRMVTVKDALVGLLGERDPCTPLVILLLDDSLRQTALWFGSMWHSLCT